MGIYQDHGVQYLAVLKDGQTITVVSSNEADARLARSSFYLKRKEQWHIFQPQLSLVKPITVDDFDIVLLPVEEEKLAKVMKLHDVDSHGWYEVVSTGDSY